MGRMGSDFAPMAAYKKKWTRRGDAKAGVGQESGAEGVGGEEGNGNRVRGE